MDEAEFWGDARACPECGSRFFGIATKVYCSIKCKNAVCGRKRRQNPEKVKADSARKAAWRQTPKGQAYLEKLQAEKREADRYRRKPNKRIDKADTNLILDDWVWIGPYVGWSVERAAPRIGVGHDRLLKILREAREAGDPRGVIPETVGGQRVYAAA